MKTFSNNVWLLGLIVALSIVFVLTLVFTTSSGPVRIVHSLLPIERIIPHAHLLEEDEVHPLLHRFQTPLSAPTSVNLYPTTSLIPVDDQGQFGSCTAHAARYAWQLMLYRAQTAAGKPFSNLPGGPSKAFLYAQSRVRFAAQYNNGPLTASQISAALKEDNGSSNEATIWVLRNIGLVGETNYPYTSANVIGGVAPSTAAVPARGGAAAIPAASTYKFNGYPAYAYPPSQTITLQPLPVQVSFGASANAQAQTLQVILNALATKHAVIVGILVYSSFETPSALQSGVIPMPSRSDAILGGHAICLSGYNSGTNRFVFRNSWGTRYGSNGSFTIPYAYITNPNYTFDSWIL